MWMLAGKERVVVRLGTGQPCCWCAQDSEGPEKLRRAEQTLVQRAGLSLLPVTLCRRGWAQAVSTHGNCRVSAVQMPGGVGGAQLWRKDARNPDATAS